MGQSPSTPRLHRTVGQADRASVMELPVRVQLSRSAHAQAPEARRPAEVRLVVGRFEPVALAIVVKSCRGAGPNKMPGAAIA